MAAGSPFPNPVIASDLPNQSRRFGDNGDGTILDRWTGLQWEKKSNDGSVHDCSGFGTWGIGGNPLLEDLLLGTIQAEFISSLNTLPCFANHCDWRIPNVVEAQSLVKRDETDPATFAAFDDGCSPGCTVLQCSCACEMWTSTSYWNNSRARAWRVDLERNGETSAAEKTDVIAVRAVRGGR